MNLFSVKDKFIRRLDSVSNKKFIYKFLTVTGSEFNELVMDESELKMNVRGRLYGDNKNNPLSQMKVMLLNDTYEIIDSAMTDKNGDFAFKHMPYTKQILISADNEKSILESFSNILVFDNEDNLIKMVSMVKGQKFNYKPLQTEYSKLTDLYVDDPWLTIIDKETSANNKAHSDSKGGDAYNLKLSEQRANASKAYIISKGIAANRISAKGFGETKLLNNCGNSTICSDDEHAVNRRLEFKLIFK